ncbi:hypothetical protein SDC9_181897 [bioreactor metagenome]|uniref:Uncharacterized protein n=1 Tax=bioreactor metagenome TaxID=1076179 RepID=A0A645HE77_9ZZZZ
MEVGIFLHPVQGRGEGRQYLLKTFLPLPKPNWINMGITNHVQDFASHTRPPQHFVSHHCSHHTGIHIWCQGKCGNVPTFDLTITLAGRLA